MGRPDHALFKSQNNNPPLWSLRLYLTVSTVFDFCVSICRVTNLSDDPILFIPLLTLFLCVEGLRLSVMAHSGV
jgi:hypothetical protein